MLLDPSYNDEMQPLLLSSCFVPIPHRLLSRDGNKFWIVVTLRV